MGQQVILPKFELPGDKPHWAVRAAWIAGGLLLISVIGLGAAVMHRNSVETQAHLAKAEALARIKSEAEAKVAAAAAAARASKEAEIAAKAAAIEAAAAAKAKAKADAAALAATGDDGSTKGAPKSSHGHHGKARPGKGGKTVAKADSSSSKSSGGSARNDAAIDAIPSKIK